MKKQENKKHMRTRKKSQFGEIWRRLRRNKLAMLGMAIVFVLVFVAVFADVLAPYDYTAANFAERLQMPNKSHLLGTDNLGRDLLSRIIYGGRTSLLVACLAIVISLLVGGFFGATAAYFGGWYETVVMRVTDVFMAIPTTLLAISISAALGSGTFNTALAISVSGMPAYVRLMRACTMSAREQEYVEAARCTGSSDMRIIFRHIVPNTLASIIVDATLRVGANILAISGLSFIGLGVQPPAAEWGSILTSGREYIRDFWPLVTFPGLAIMLTLFGFNLFGDGLRDAFDPRLKQ